MKHEAFESNYRPDFEVVEQRQGKVHCYPHTEQLPVLFRALNFEFKGGLPPRLARVDHRADGFHKLMLHSASLFFCNSLNGTRPDELHLLCLPDHQLVSRPTIVQHVIEDARLGSCHSFRFYGGEDFFREIYLCGKRVIFADHALMRFKARVRDRFGDELNTLLLLFFGTKIQAMRCGRGFAFVICYKESMLAFPFDETDDEFFVKSCLTVNEINDLGFHMPPYTVDRHYDLPYKAPEVRNWYPCQVQADAFEAWKAKKPLSDETATSFTKKVWSRVAYRIKDHTESKGHGPDSQLRFLDDLPGPAVYSILPNEELLRHREEEELKKTSPEYDWDEVYARRRAEKRIGENEFKSGNGEDIFNAKTRSLLRRRTTNGHE